MRHLLDTNIVLAAGEDLTRLPRRVREILSAEASSLWYSAAVPWEVAIRFSLGKLKVGPAAVLDQLAAARVQELAIRAAHTFELVLLPYLHRDPFDRIQIAQARSERMRMVTFDATLKRYDADVLLVR